MIDGSRDDTMAAQDAIDRQVNGGGMKKQKKKMSDRNILIENCTVTNKAEPMTSLHVDALRELAVAARENAHAIAEIAKAMKSPNVTMGHGIYIASPGKETDVPTFTDRTN